MGWDVLFDEAFEPEFDALPEAVQDELLAHAKLLEEFGPHLGRPRVDTLNGSAHANMKELRFDADGGVWRVALLSIQSARRSSWWRATNPAAMKSDFTRRCSRRPTRGSMPIWNA